jgi:hypothetical protein
LIYYILGALTAETRIKEVQERYQEHLQNPDATIFKLINLQYTLPVVFRHVPTVPEAHYRQIHVIPSMDVRQVLDIVTREMGLKALENPATNGSNARAPSEYIFSQLKVNGEDVEGTFHFGPYLFTLKLCLTEKAQY